MPTLEWLRNEFNYGYSSGNVLGLVPSVQRLREQRKMGGSLKRYFNEVLRTQLRAGARVLELGPGRGSWSRAVMSALPEGELHTIDYQDVGQWIKPTNSRVKLVHHRVAGHNYDQLQDSYFDFFFSVGVLVHNNAEDVERVMSGILPKMKPGAASVQHYSDWDKLDAVGWAKWTGITPAFKNMPDAEIWWPRNSKTTMQDLCQRAGWTVEEIDLGYFRRDSVALLRRPQAQ